MGLFSRGNGGRVSEEQVLRALRTVEEPELGGDLVSRNMIKNVVIDGERVAFTVELTRSKTSVSRRWSAWLACHAARWRLSLARWCARAAACSIKPPSRA